MWGGGGTRENWGTSKNYAPRPLANCFRRHWYGIVVFNVPLDTAMVISDTAVLSDDLSRLFYSVV